MPEVLPVPVHDEHEMLRPLLAQKLEQHTPHDVQRSRGKAVGAGHAGVGKKSPEQKGVSVHHVEGFFGKTEALLQ